MKEFITENSKQTQKLGEMLAQEIKGGKIICLTGELGSGKTTFTQGLLKDLRVKGPYTSPTFVIMKKYGKNIFHFDAYRVRKDDIINLGWEEIIADENNVIIVEWADRISKIIPRGALWIGFEWMDENKRKISFLSRHPERNETFSRMKSRDLPRDITSNNL
ncbi:MAG: tRNA (adenosine(37)-N6)-threonylcarbamoyltransferase complex ATPase subunit type 1 TsaE [Parcubacteria group bacterium]|jgi:tRNA threonylcarbamoyladenosine biosynthesis protein TsaE